MLRRFQENLESTGLVPPGARVLVGYSGGADSTCLLHLFSQAGYDVVAAHLHHGQRTEADEELERCAQFAESIGVPFVSGRADVLRLATETGTGLEEAGRNARYGFFESAMPSTGCHLTATAHTLDDHTETVLLNLARGSGLTGLRGIPARRDWIVRPLLPFSRIETRAYCGEHQFWYHDDPSNSDIQFSRARVRHRIIPELEAINPGIRESVLRLSQIVATEEDLLNGIAAAALEGSEKRLNGDLAFLTQDCEVAFLKQKLLAHPKAVVVRALRLAAGTLGGQLEYDQSQALFDALFEPRGSWTFTGGTVTLEWDDHSLRAYRIEDEENFRFPLTVPGETDNVEHLWTLVAKGCPPASFQRPPKSLDVVVDSDAIKGPLHFRNTKPGDRIDPLGLDGTKKLSDLFQEAGLTAPARNRLPIVCDMVGPVWVPGVCIAERVKITENSIKALNFCLKALSAHMESAARNG